MPCTDRARPCRANTKHSARRLSCLRQEAKNTRGRTAVGRRHERREVHLPHPSSPRHRATKAHSRPVVLLPEHQLWRLAPHLSGLGISPRRCLEWTSSLQSTLTPQVSRTNDSGRYCTSVPTKNCAFPVGRKARMSGVDVSVFSGMLQYLLGRDVNISRSRAFRKVKHGANLMVESSINILLEPSSYPGRSGNQKC